MTHCIESFENYFRPEDERFTAVLTEDEIPPACVVALRRLRLLSWAPLACFVAIVVVMIVEKSPEFIGSAGLAFLMCVILRQTSLFPKGRTLAHVSHMRSASGLFLALNVGKAFALVYSTYDACKMPDEALGELECSRVRWATAAIIGVSAYVTYVAGLVLQRLELSYLLVACRADASRSKTEELGPPGV